MPAAPAPRQLWGKGESQDPECVSVSPRGKESNLEVGSEWFGSLNWTFRGTCQAVGVWGNLMADSVLNGIHNEMTGKTRVDESEWRAIES